MSSSIFPLLTQVSHIQSIQSRLPFQDGFQDMLQNKKATWRCRHNANNRFFHLLREQLWTTETTTFIWMIARNFTQWKQPFLWFNANNDRNLLWEYNPDNYFLSLGWIILTYHLQHQQPVHRLKMEDLMSRCTNETTQATMGTTLTTTFGILNKTFMHTIYNLQREQPVYMFKAKNLISLSTN